MGEPVHERKKNGVVDEAKILAEEPASYQSSPVWLPDCDVE